MSIKELAEKYIAAELKAFREGNFDDLETLENPNVIYHIAEWPDIIGFEGHKQDILMRRDAVADLQIEFEYLTGDTNLFVLTLNETGTIEKEMPGSELPVGAKYRVDNAVLIANLSDGKTKEVWIKVGSLTTEL